MLYSTNLKPKLTFSYCPAWTGCLRQPFGFPIRPSGDKSSVNVTFISCLNDLAEPAMKAEPGFETLKCAQEGGMAPDFNVHLSGHKKQMQNCRAFATKAYLGAEVCDDKSGALTSNHW